MAEATQAAAGFSVEQFGQDWLAAWNSHDPERVLALMTEDIVYDDSAWPVTMRGHADVRAFLDHTWRAFPDMSFELLEGPYRLGESRAAFWWRGQGTMTGPVDPPGFAPNGKRWEVDGVDFHEYRDGRISRLRIIFNMTEAAQQLALVPAPGSRAERLAVRLQRLTARRAGR